MSDVQMLQFNAMQVALSDVKLVLKVNKTKF